MNGEAYAATTTPSEGVEVVDDAAAHTHTYTFSLAHGEQVEFKNLPIGATYTVSEAGADNYTATATVDGTAQAAGVKGQGTTTTSTLVDADGSTTAVDNEAEDITVTGVIMNILPFVMMIAIGGAAAAMYVASRRRKMAR